jgi:hypothetical protein
MSRVMFSNLADVAAYHGASQLARMATAIATDEGRHEVALVSCCCCCCCCNMPCCVNLLHISAVYVRASPDVIEL